MGEKGAPSSFSRPTSSHHHAAHVEAGGRVRLRQRNPEDLFDLTARGLVIAVDDADRDLLPPEVGRPDGLVAVGQGLFQLEDPLPVPGVGVDLVEADAGLEDVHDGRSR